eukprot:1554715-Amphidinium_carterae.1
MAVPLLGFLSPLRHEYEVMHFNMICRSAVCMDVFAAALLSFHFEDKHAQDQEHVIASGQPHISAAMDTDDAAHLDSEVRHAASL